MIRVEGGRAGWSRELSLPLSSNKGTGCGDRMNEALTASKLTLQETVGLTTTSSVTALGTTEGPSGGASVPVAGSLGSVARVASASIY